MSSSENRIGNDQASPAKKRRSDRIAALRDDEPNSLSGHESRVKYRENDLKIAEENLEKADKHFKEAHTKLNDAVSAKAIAETNVNEAREKVKQAKVALDKFKVEEERTAEEADVNSQELEENQPIPLIQKAALQSSAGLMKKSAKSRVLTSEFYFELLFHFVKLFLIDNYVLQIGSDRMNF